jgi:hypothetical protein
LTRPPLRLCVLGDLDSIHTRRWMQPFVERGHEVHAVSYYPPSAPVDGVTVHALTAGSGAGESAAGNVPTKRTLRERLPPTPLRLINALRYRRRGLASTIRRIQPHVLHAHYAVEYGFFAATAGFHPLVVTAWGSDILVAAQRSPFTRAIARYTLHHADLVTSNNQYMTRKIIDLGVPAEKVETVVLGTERFFLALPRLASVQHPSPAQSNEPRAPPSAGRATADSGQRPVAAGAAAARAGAGHPRRR